MLRRGPPCPLLQLDLLALFAKGGANLKVAHTFEVTLWESVERVRREEKK